MKHINNSEILAMEKFYRINLVNSLGGYKSLHLLGTAGEDGVTNLCLVSSVFHLGADPPLIGLVMRPQREHNDTLRNIRATGQYTLNNVLPDWYELAHQTSASYPSGVSEFDACGFKKLYSPGFKAPFVQQSTVRIGLELREVIDMELNATTILIGEVAHILLDEQVITGDGTIDHMEAGTMTVAGLDSYFSAEFVGRLTYAKPGVQPTKFDQ
ncbi:flavin reductase family protein [Mucilaginibacter pedocola]|uniref:Flavin reductase n=1 Tax=Mucilaginibacter pedocola TaxID=1792845 RepID=A0A1S9P6Q6_9SPHI|nr:flavin reductase [Mucilaginibacter pedocola]OOQ56640.1 flavin reductase [Mucilaginibacter pedocola]